MSRRTLRAAVAFGFTLLCEAGGRSLAEELRVESPGGAVRLDVSVDERGPKLHVALKERPVVEIAGVTLSIDGVPITQGTRAGKAERYRLDETYPWRGGHSTAVNRCEGARIPLEHPASGTRYTLEVRAFDDGAAYRFVVPGEEGKARVPDETARFVVPGNSTVWHHGLGGHYEDTYDTGTVESLEAGEWAAPPVTFRLPDGGGYASITEAALTNYSGMALRADGQGALKLVLGHAHPVSYPFELRYKEDIERVSMPAAVAGVVTTPWRVVLVGPDLNTLVNSDVVHNLCPPPDPEFFPQGANTEWVKPGRAVWRYLDGGERTLDAMKEFGRAAGELGFEYHVIEGFWSRWSDEELRDLVEDSRRNGVGLIVWRHSKELRTPEAREEFFSRLSRLGVAGAKIDFFDHEHKDVIDQYTLLLRDAARHKLVVNFHGSNKPTGDSRPWPNELVRESVRGMESSRLKERARHDATLPFTRFLAGPADYTPLHFGERRADTTWAHQIATAAVFTAPLLTYAARPEAILGNPGVEVIKSIPAVWDETVVLPGSEVGEVAAFARRSGDMWFVAVVNGPAARELPVPLSFLAEGEYRVLSVRDDENDPAAVQVERSTASRGDTLEVNLANGGGFVARFTKN